MRIVHYRQAPSVPWKNGLGLTRQLAIHPAGATAESFEWRLSIAQLDHDADFSVFPGIERCLAVLEGRLLLERVGSESVQLAADSPPARFPGDVAARGVVLQGPVLDLNLMYRLASWQPSLARLQGEEGVAHLRSTAGMLLCSLLPALRVCVGETQVTLDRYDVLVLAPGEAQALSGVDGASFDAYGIELQRR